MRTLWDLQRGETASVKELFPTRELSLPLMEAGFTPGTPVTLVHISPCGSLGVYRLEGVEIAIRRDMAAMIQIEEAA